LERDGVSRMEYVRVACEGFQRGEEDIELSHVSGLDLKRENYVKGAYYCRTRIGGSMARKLPRGSEIHGCNSSKSRIETRLREIFSW
jgi:hypothetical protein